MGRPGQGPPGTRACVDSEQGGAVEGRGGREGEVGAGARGARSGAGSGPWALSAGEGRGRGPSLTLGDSSCVWFRLPQTSSCSDADLYC